MAFKHMLVEAAKIYSGAGGVAGASVQVGDYDILCIMMKVADMGGTGTPKLVSKVQVSYDNENWADLQDSVGTVAFADITADGYYCREVRTGATWLRLHHTLSDTAPTFTLTTYIEAKKAGF